VYLFDFSNVPTVCYFCFSVYYLRSPIGIYFYNNVLYFQARIIAIQESSITGSYKTKNGIIRNELKSTVMISLLLGCFTLSWSPMMIYFFYSITCTTPPCDVNRYIRYIWLDSNFQVSIFWRKKRAPTCSTLPCDTKRYIRYI
jgi:hypothetical protein